MGRARRFLLVAAALALAALLWWLSVDGDRRSPSLDSEETSAATPPPPPMLRGGAREQPPEPGEETSVQEPTAAAARAEETATPGVVRIEGSVRQAASGAALDPRRMGLSYRPAGGGRLAARQVEIETDRAGTFTHTIETSDDLEIRSVYPLEGEWQTRAWYPHGGKPGDAIPARPGTTTRIVVELAPTLSLRGIVVNEEGEPIVGVRIRFQTPQANGSPIWSSMFTESIAEGRFSVMSLLADPAGILPADQVRQASEVLFELPGYTPRRINVHDVPEGERSPWRVVLLRGLTLSGQLFDDKGGVLPNVTVEAVYDDDSRRRTATTDADGRFRLETLSPGKLTLKALVLEHDLVAGKELTLSASREGVELVAAPFDLDHPLQPTAVMGLHLADVTDEVRTKYGLAKHVNVVVTDPGANHLRLGIGALREGYGIWMLGKEPVKDVKDFVTRILKTYDEKAKKPGGDTERLHLRIVYTYGGAGARAGWTNTQRLSLGPDDIASLRRTAANLR